MFHRKIHLLNWLNYRKTFENETSRKIPAKVALLLGIFIMPFAASAEEIDMKEKK